MLTAYWPNISYGVSESRSMPQPAEHYYILTFTTQWYKFVQPSTCTDSRPRPAAMEIVNAKHDVMAYIQVILALCSSLRIPAADVLIFKLPVYW
jgi:hypothetical protein